MQLTNLETAGLRLAIAKDDNAVRQSIETFRSDNDQDNLMDNLRSIARATIAETMSENQFDYTEEVPDAEEVEESPETIELLHRPSTIESHLKNGEYERKHDSAKNTQSAVTVEDVNDNDDDDDDEEDDDDDNDDEDEDDEDYDGDDNEDEGPGRSVMVSFIAYVAQLRNAHPQWSYVLAHYF